MNSTLHCNDLKCRALVNDRAVVTTCSHVFCLSCADRLELSAPKDGQRKCPACGTLLLNPDDAVVTSLNPTEDYKTSILSGLSPTVIMECAGRGLSFWAYQMASEITYQEYLAMSLKNRYAELSAHMEQNLRSVNDEKSKLQAKLEHANQEHLILQERFNNLESSYRQKEKAWETTKKLYTQLKNAHMAAGIEIAADHDAENVLQGSQFRQSQARPSALGMHRNGSGNSGGSGGSDERRRKTYPPAYATQGYVSQASQNYQPVNRSGLSTSQSNPALTTQTANRQRLPNPTFGHYNSTFNAQPGASRPREDGVHGGTPLRYQGGTHAQSPQQGRGLSAGIRVGNPQPYMPASRAGPTRAAAYGSLPGLGAMHQR